MTAETRHGAIRFLNHGRGSWKRARTLLTKEPDSLKWIDAMAPGSVFWDIGANVGALSLYAARRGNLDVWAFEPAAVNYYNLTANCQLNNFEKTLHCLLAGIGETNRLDTIHVSQLASARSFTFRMKPSQKGNGMCDAAAASPQLAPIFTVDGLIDDYEIPPPNYVKIDVPGMTLDILQGASKTLASPSLKQLQIEAKEHGGGGRQVIEVLSRHGFSIVRRHMKKSGTVQGDLVFARCG